MLTKLQMPGSSKRKMNSGTSEMKAKD